MAEWDPIGVATVAQAQDEYNTYAGKLSAMLQHGTSDQAIHDYLAAVETELMQVPTAPERLWKVVAAIRAAEIN